MPLAPFRDYGLWATIGKARQSAHVWRIPWRLRNKFESVKTSSERSAVSSRPPLLAYILAGDEVARRVPCGVRVLQFWPSVARRDAGTAASSAGRERFRTVVRPPFSQCLFVGLAHSPTSFDSRRSGAGHFSATVAERGAV